MEKALSKTIIMPLIKFLSVLGIILIVQILFKNQFIVGSLVNTILICSLFFFGIYEAIGIAILPSVLALIFGILPTPLAPFVPFIIASNIILILCFYLFKNNYIVGAFCGSVFKFLFLFFSSSIIFSYFFGHDLPAKILSMMSYPQLITAIAGSLLAFIILKRFKKI